MPPHIVEYFRLKSGPVAGAVAVAMTPERNAVGAWFLNARAGRLERASHLISTISKGSHLGRLAHNEYQSLCLKANVDGTIPEASLKMAFRLAEIAMPAYTIPANQPLKLSSEKLACV